MSFKCVRNYAIEYVFNIIAAESIGPKKKGGEGGGGVER